VGGGRTAEDLGRRLAVIAASVGAGGVGEVRSSHIRTLEGAA
ncbi:hypothetical protein N136_01795, partial [Leifsonia aquatica ATCC 14665]